jgi:formylglycine-generating enzyme required for sulfatase activity
MNFSGWLATIAVLVTLSTGRAWAGETATAVATLTAGFVTGITVTSGGFGYVSEPAVTLTGGGGGGATAKAIMAGDKVGAIVVLAAGSGYTASPMVTLEAPLEALGVMVELVPKLTVVGTAGSLARVESAASLAGLWTTWTNITVGAEGLVLVDLSPESAARFYRAVSEATPFYPGFVWIPSGTFLMGSPDSETGRESDEAEHKVTLTEGFWMSDHVVTQGEYKSAVGNNPSNFKGDVNRPVEMVSWSDAVAYCQKLTDQERAIGRITVQQAYRLPTEAEWEYAARAGSTAMIYGVLDDIAWHQGNSNEESHPVKQKARNAWRLHDMIGNVAEWCSDRYGTYPSRSVVDPVGANSTDVRIRRGGSWSSSSSLARAADREWNVPGFRNINLGFRPVLSAVR